MNIRTFNTGGAEGAWRTINAIEESEFQFTDVWCLQEIGMTENEKEAPTRALSKNGHNFVAAEAYDVKDQTTYKIGGAALIIQKELKHLRNHFGSRLFTESRISVHYSSLIDTQSFNFAHTLQYGSEHCGRHHNIALGLRPTCRVDAMSSLWMPNA